MSLYRKRLPPLDTLVFFECTVRRGSFTDAAAELFVSQAAVSKRIRQLEDWLGTSLFDRRAHQLEPTPAARRLYDRAAMSLEFLAQSVAEARAPGFAMVRISSMTSVGMFWLQPRLQQFALGDAACMFNLTLSDDLTVLFSDENDLALVYGDGTFPGWNARRVLTEELAPLATPAVAARLAAAGALADHEAPLLDYDRLSPDWVDWGRWADLLGLTIPSDLPIVRCASYTQSVGRALEGRGVLLGSLPLLQSEITVGRLSRLDQPSYLGQGGYWLVWPEGRHLTPEAETIRKTLAPGYTD